MNHLEQLISEWLEFKGYIVRRNIRVGKIVHGAYVGELDVVAYHPTTKHILHVEPSYSTSSWDKRDILFTKKFDAGKKYINKEVFPWIDALLPVERWAVLWGSSKIHRIIGGGKVIPVPDLYKRIAQDVRAIPPGSSIPEKFPLLRTMQFTLLWVTGEI